MFGYTRCHIVDLQVDIINQLILVVVLEHNLVGVLETRFDIQLLKNLLVFFQLIFSL